MRSLIPHPRAATEATVKKNAIRIAWVFALLLVLIPVSVDAQGVGIFSRPDCTTLTGAVSGQTICWDSTAGYWRAYDGTRYTSDAARATKIVNVLDYGALCDGSTDDRTAIQAAIDVLTDPVDGVVFIPPGRTCRIASSLSIPNGSLRVTIRGGGWSSILQWSGGNNGVMIDVPTTAAVSGLFIETLQFSLSAAQTGTAVLRVGTADLNPSVPMTQLYIRDCQFNGAFNPAIRLNSEVDEVYIRENWFFDIVQAVYGYRNTVSTSSNSNLEFWGNHFQGVTGTAIVNEGGSKYSFVANTFHATANGARVLTLDRWDALYFAGNYIEFQGTTDTNGAIELGPSNASDGGGVITGNHVSGGGTATKVKITRGDKLWIAGNWFDGAAASTALTIASTAGTGIVVGPNFWSSNITTRIAESGSTASSRVDATQGHRLSSVTNTISSLGLNTESSGTVTDYNHTDITTDWASGTITRENIFNIRQPTGAGAVTNMTLFRTDAAIGTHKMINSGNATTSIGTTQAWLKINLDGVLHYIPIYSGTNP